MEATWHETIMVHDDAEALTLQNELGNDHAITLTCRKSNHEASVAGWTGSGEHDFNGETAETFQRWIREAMPDTRFCRSGQ
jgi:hypothetical protein